MGTRKFNDARQLSLFLRDRVDEFAGQELPQSFKDEYLEIISNPIYKKMVFRGAGYSATMRYVLRDFRLKRLDEIMEKR